MKTFRLFGLALMTVLLSFGFASCSDDDDPADGGEKLPIESKNIVGKWKCVATYELDCYMDEEKRITGDESMDGETFAFNEDGKGVYDLEEKFPLVWKIENGKLKTTIDYGDGDIDTGYFIIDYIKKNELSLIIKKEYSESNEWAQERYVFERIK